MLKIALLTGASMAHVACVPKTSATEQGLADAVGWACFDPSSGMDCNDMPKECKSNAARATFAFSKYFNLFGGDGGTCDFNGNAHLGSPAPENQRCQYFGHRPTPTPPPTAPPTDPPTDPPTPPPTHPPTNPPTNPPTAKPPTPQPWGPAPGAACIPISGTSDSSLAGAVGWACTEHLSGIGCEDIPEGCTSSNHARATFAFSKYFEKFGSSGGSCDFAGHAHIATPASELAGCVYGAGEAPAPAPEPTPIASGSRCGIATSLGKCAETQQAVGAAMECFSYGGSTDPCSLNNNNDPNDGLDKSPLECNAEHFFLWDEPDTQGRSYGWAGAVWKNYCSRWSSELYEFKARGGKVVGPAVKNDKYVANMREFFGACGSACTEEGPCKIDEAAANVFVGSWNNGNLRGGIQWSIDQFERFNRESGLNLPVAITNWSYLGSNTADAQLEAMEVTEEFFKASHPVEITQAYYFLARDFGGGTTNNLATDRTSSGKTLGEHWKEICQDLDN